ncbi:MAG: aminotransferase class V-fold PLP-dependent enzyme [Acidimicrobiia bacterium]|nr:aminotransferase class V-fold PLP-dependent enzyme [Acidimicrobiia bacterium]
MNIPADEFLATVRASFPGLDDKTFLDAACVSLAPQEASDAILEFLDLAIQCRAADASEHHVAMDHARRRAAAEAARLLSVPERNLALVESTTYGLNVAAQTIPLSRGDNVLIADTEFLQVAIPWVNRRRVDGIEIKSVASDRGELSLDRFEQSIDRRTRVVCVSSVQWSSGYRVDIPGLGELCRERGIWLIVDAVQEMGALKIDLSGQPADFVIAGGHKWLNAPFGCGVMCLSDNALESLKPSSYGYLSLEEPSGGWGTFFRTPGIPPVREYQFPSTARQFEVGGTANYPGAIGLAASLRMINGLGIEVIERHVRRLGEVLRQGLVERGARLVSAPLPQARSGITTFGFHDTPEEDYRLLQKMLADRVFISMRYTGPVGGLRVSTHFYNTEDDVLRLLDSLDHNT